MKKILILYILLSFSACKKEEKDNPVEFINISGIWFGTNNLSLYTLSFSNRNVKVGNRDKEFNYPIINVNYFENTFEIYCKSYGVFQKFKKSSNQTIKIDVNDSFDTITYKSLKYTRK